MKNDPLFRPLRETSRVISLHRITSIYRPRESSDGRDQAELEEGEWTQHAGAQYQEGQDVMDRLEHSLSAGHPKEPPATGSRTASWDRTPQKDSFTYSRPNRPFEDAVALRGIDGPYRPHHHTVWPLPPPPAREGSPAASPERTPPMRTRTPSMYEL